MSRKKVVVDVPCRALDLRANYCMLVTSTLCDSRGLSGLHGQGSHENEIENEMDLTPTLHGGIGSETSNSKPTGFES